MFKKLKERKPEAISLRRQPRATYYRSETPEDTPSPFKTRQVRKSKRRFLLGFLDVVLVTLLLAGIVYSLVIKPTPKVIVSSTAYHPAATYSKAVSEQFNKIQNRNKVLFNDVAVTSNLKKQFPEIVSAQIELPFISQNATVRLLVSKPIMNLNSHGNVYVVDTQGVVVANSNSVPAAKKLVLVDDQTGFKAAQGKQVLSASEVDFINQVILQSRRANVQISSILLPTAPEELQVRVKDQPYYVKFYLGGDALKQTGQFLAARNHFDQNHQSPSEYLDVRVEGKIFYK